MNRARQLTLLTLVVLVVAFVPTWLTIPNKERHVGTRSVSYPARTFAVGLMVETHCSPRSAAYGWCVPEQDDAIRRRDIPALEHRVKTVFGGAVAVAVLAGLAFGAGRSREAP